MRWRITDACPQSLAGRISHQAAHPTDAGALLIWLPLSQALSINFQRIQFTPDLLPADLVGTLIYNQKEGDFIIKKGPIFSNIILADEINRAPARTQSALLECMDELQVTVDG